MRYLIIGLGIYGSNLARDLTDMGHEIIGADNRRQNVDAIKDYISTAYCIDATEESSLSLLPLNNVDLVIVAIGENFGASIKVVALLKKLGVKHIYARAIDRLHESILEGFDIDRIVTPEQRAARDLSHEMALGVEVQALAIDSDTYVLRFRTPSLFVGLKYSDINLRSTFGLQLIAVAREQKTTNLMGISRLEARCFDFSAPDTVVEEGDVFTCLGKAKAYYSLYKQLQHG